jgi:hypothetical protein
VVRTNSTSLGLWERAIQVHSTTLAFGHSIGLLPCKLPLSRNFYVSLIFSRLRNTKREDMVFIAFQFWLLGMSIVALLNESIPHIFASLLTHMLATGWAIFQITHTATFRSEFSRVITKGACKHITLLPHYWEARGQAEIPSLVMHVVALVVSCFLTWRLIKVFFASSLRFPLTRWIGIWLADIQTSRCFTHNQPLVQDRPHSIHRHSIISIFHGRHCVSLD